MFDCLFGKSATECWANLERVLSVDPNLKHTPKAIMGKILFAGKTPEELGVTDALRINQGSVLTPKESCNSGVPQKHQGMEEYLYDLLSRGHVDSAKRAYLQYMTQPRVVFGPPGRRWGFGPPERRL